MLSVPTGSVEVVSIAEPEERLSLPNNELPLKNCTVPRGVPLAAVTLAVNVIAVP
jgi:hypothetical protein